MAGRGRGRRMPGFCVDAIGISRGDPLPPSMQQPTPVFPVSPAPLTPEPLLVCFPLSVAEQTSTCRCNHTGSQIMSAGGEMHFKNLHLK